MDTVLKMPVIHSGDKGKMAQGQVTAIKGLCYLERQADESLRERRPLEVVVHSFRGSVVTPVSGVHRAIVTPFHTRFNFSKPMEIEPV